MTEQNNNKQQGTITVFFSLILVIILSFVLTIVEGARINSAQLLTQQALLVSMDSVLAGYYRPLWDEYHIFGLDTGYGTSEEHLDEVSSRMEEYITDQINPTHPTGNQEEREGVDLHKLSVGQIQIENPAMLTDYQGELFLYQCSEYMKYKVLGNGVEQILDQMSLMETPKKVSIIYEEKVKVEEELSKIDKGILKLMELFDGVKTSKKGIVLTEEGGLSINPNFIKKICISEITQPSVGINHPVVFQVLKDRYYNPIKDMTLVEEKIGLIQSKQNENYKYQTEIQNNNLRIMDYTREIDELNRKKSLKNSDRESIRTLQGLIQDLIDKSNSLSEKITENDNRIREYHTQALDTSRAIRNVINHILPLYQDADKVLDDIIKQQDSGRAAVSGLEQLLVNEKEGLEEEIYQSLFDELNQMKKYVGDGIIGYDFNQMKVVLSENETSLRTLKSSVGEIIQLIEENKISQSLEQSAIGREGIKNYQISELAIDYSSLVLDYQKKSNLNAMKNLIEKSLYQLVIDTEDVSKKSLSNELRPSTAYESVVNATTFSFSEFFTSIIKDQGGDQLPELFQGINNQESGVLVGLGQVVNQLAKIILYQEYYQEHFYDYESGRENEKVLKPSVLDYEREYLLFGNTADEDNLWSMINYMLISRVMLNFISLLKDKSSCKEAYLMAAAMVGFTGLPILVNITKIMILLVWSFGESLVDTAALLQGRRITVIKNKLTMSLPELLLINSSYIKEKATGITNSAKGSGLSIGYQDYLYLLLLSRNSNQVVYRAMDLVQENLRIRYDDNFRMNLCLYGFTAKVSYSMPTKFTSILSGNHILQGNKGYTIIKQSQYSY